MNQITVMLAESNSRMKKLMRGLENASQKPDLELVSSAQREFEGQIKAVNLVLQAYAIHSKNRRTFSGLDKMNIMDDTTAIDLGLGDQNLDKVKCPDKGKLITRAECLDYSGEHYEDCAGCETGKDTKARLLEGPTTQGSF